RGSVDLNLGLIAGERWGLEAPCLEPLREQAPARAVEPEHLCEAPPLVQVEVEVPIHRAVPEPANLTRARVTRPPHVQRFHRHEHAYGWRQAQHDRRTPTIRRSISSCASSPNSIAAPPIRMTYRAELVAVAAVAVGMSSTSWARPTFVPRLVRAMFHAWS